MFISHLYYECLFSLHTPEFIHIIFFRKEKASEKDTFLT